MVEMCQNDVVAPLGQLVVKDDRPDLTRVRMCQPCGTRGPTSDERRQVEHGALFSVGIEPNPLRVGRAQRKLSGQVKCDLDGGLDVLRR